MTPPLRLLVVDDEEDFLRPLVHRLKLRGLEVEGASSGLEALDILDRRPMDVIVLDVRMPDMDGIETLRRVKELHPLVEVVMLTGHADLESSLEGMRFGFYDYLTKPVSIDSLVAKVEEAHDRRPAGPAAEPEPETFGEKLRQHMVVADRLASLGQLAATIAHEINNPLAVVAESAGWLRSRTEGRPDVPADVRETLGEALDAIDRAVDRAARISRNFLYFARAPDAHPRDVDLRELAAEVRDLTSRHAAARDVRIEVAEGPTVAVRTDPFQLRQVLLNLVTNAIQAVADGGRVDICVDVLDGGVAVVVSDDGVGIPPENLERIFEPFFTTKAEGQGTGLGLAVSRGIVERLGGRIEVESRPGHGSTFRVVLPRAARDTGTEG